MKQRSGADSRMDEHPTRHESGREVIRLRFRQSIVNRELDRMSLAQIKIRTSCIPCTLLAVASCPNRLSWHGDWACMTSAAQPEPRGHCLIPHFAPKCANLYDSVNIHHLGTMSETKRSDHRSTHGCRTCRTRRVGDSQHEGSD